MARQGAVAALALFLASCASGSAPKTASPAGEFQVTVEIEGAAPREGELALVTFRIQNGTRNSIVLRDLTLPRDLMLTGSTSSVVTWQFAPPGLLTYAPERDEWIYDKGRRPDVRRPVFNSIR